MTDTDLMRRLRGWAISDALEAADRIEALEAELKQWRSYCALGVGRGDGDLFVYSSYEATKIAQEMCFKAEKAEALERENAKTREALTPSADTKAAYMGEFSIPLSIQDEEGNDVMLRPNVPWTTIKEIMKAICARAALGDKS